MDEQPRWNGNPDDWGRDHYRDIPWSKWVLKARQRHINDLKRAESDPTFPYRFDWEKSDDAVWFFSCLRHFQSPFNGQPFILADWQEWDIIRPLFGWVKKEDGTRRFIDANIFIPKKNGKSPLAAGIAGLLFIADKEYGGEVACAATKEDQARIVWNYARRMMDLSPELRDEYKTFKRALSNEQLGSRFFYIGKDSKGSDGLNLNGAIVDEYHAHKTSEMKDIVRQAMASRLQPLCVTITTLGYGDKTPCEDELEIAKAVLDGRINDETYFAFFSTVDDPEKWDQEEEWYKANPNLGISIPLSRFREDLETARKSPRKLAEFKCKRLNIKQSRVGSWLPVTVLERCRAPEAIPWAHFRGRRCFGGADLGIVGDLSAAAFLFQGDSVGVDKDGRPEPPKVYAKTMYWVPEEGLHDRYVNDRVPYEDWVASGHMIPTPGSTRRSDIIIRDIKEQIVEVYDLAKIGADQTNAHDLITALADLGVEVEKTSQGFAGISFGAESFEAAVIERRFQYFDDPVMEWMLGNTAVLRNAKDQVMFAKHASRGRIDMIVALAMAFRQLAIAPDPTNFVYNTMGIYSR